MKHITLTALALLIFSLLSPMALASEKDEKDKSPFAYSGFSGGMMLHTGYVSAGNICFNGAGSDYTTVNMSGIPYGIGGALKVNFGKYLRIGSEGYVSTLNYAENHSYESIGWGGILADGVLPLGKFMPFIGVTVGGGGVKNITVLENTTNDYQLDDRTTSYRHYSFFALDPFVGMEYALTERIHLVLKADFLMNLSARQDDFVRGPRIYAGFMFCH